MAHILLAEDDHAMRQFLSAALERAGHQVSAFGDGLAAYTYFQGVVGDVDLLLTDIVMPGMDGIELSQRALTDQPSLRIMYITGFGTVSRETLPNGAANAQIMAKPLHLSQLVSEVEKLLAPVTPLSPTGE